MAIVDDVRHGMEISRDHAIDLIDITIKAAASRGLDYVPLELVRLLRQSVEGMALMGDVAPAPAALDAMKEES